MDEEENYFNLPIKKTSYNPDMFHPKKLPSGYFFLKKGSKKGHIVREEQIDRKALYSVGQAICGIEAKREQADREPLGNCCVSCMRRLDDIMNGYLYDEENNEYYDPVSG